MNPLLVEALGSIVRWLLAGAAGWLVQHGVWSAAQSQTYVMAAGLALLSLGWSLWQKYRSRLHFLTALESPAGTTESAVTDKIKNGTGATLALVLGAVLGAGVVVSSCASAPIVSATGAEHVAVTAVHGVVQAEARAFATGAYDNAKHQQYVSALLKVVQSEKALNDALMTWNAASGQPMPAVVSIAVQSIQKILADVSPLIPTNSTIGALVASANAAIGALTGGK